MGTWIILGFLSVATISCATYFFRHRGYSRWPTVPGTIETLIAIHSLGGSPSAPLYGVLSYSYKINGEYYSGEWSTPQQTSRNNVTEFVQKYLPPGSEVVVRHHPRDLGRSVLDIDPELGKTDELTQLKI
jgi:Protein of unknown function (DUF3592)